MLVCPIRDIPFHCYGMHLCPPIVFASCCAATGLFAQQRTPESITVPGFAVRQLPRLQQQSVWGSDGQRGPAPQAKPTFFAGDGRLLAAVGQHAACEPVLQTLGQTARLRLHAQPSADGQIVRWQRHRIRRVRASTVLAGVDRTDDLELRSVGFAQDGAYWLLLEIVNLDDAPKSDVAVRFRLGEDTRGWTWSSGDLAPLASRSTALRIALLPAELRRVSTERALQQLTKRLAKPPGRLRLDADQPELPDFVRDATASLLACHAEGVGPVDPRSGHFEIAAATGPLLAWLRQGRWDLAADILDSEYRMALTTGQVSSRIDLATLRRNNPPTRPEAGWNETTVESPEAACWTVLHHYWYLRGSRDSERIRAHWPLLEACVKKLPRSEDILVSGSEDQEFSASVLFLHAVACMGGMLDELDRIEHPAAWAGEPPTNPPGAAFTNKSLQLLDALEQRFWLTSENRFSPRLSDGAAEPTAVTAAGLLPCWIGMLSTTGNKTLDHAQTTLRQLGRNGDRAVDNVTTDQSSPWTQAMALVALTQCEGRERSAVLRQLMNMATDAATFLDGNGNVDLFATGAAVDAALFGTTGHRIATGPSIDVGWFRCKPMLPPGARRFACREITHDGLSFDLWIDQVRGTPTAEEQAAPTPAALSRKRKALDQRSRFVIALGSEPPGEQGVLTVVHCEGRQFQEFLRPNQPLEQSAIKTLGPPMLGAK